MTDAPSAPDNSGARRVADPETPTEGGAARRASGAGSFGGSLGWTALGTIIPGLGLWKAGRRIAGGIVLGIFVVVFGGLTVLLLTNRKMVENAIVGQGVLQGLAITTTSKGVAVSVPVTAVAGDGVTPVTCPSGDQNLTLGTSSGGALNSSIPYGTWTLRATINGQLVSDTITVDASSPVAVTLNGTV